MDSILILDRHMWFTYKIFNETRGIYIYEDKKKKGNTTQNVYYNKKKLEQ